MMLFVTYLSFTLKILDVLSIFDSVNYRKETESCTASECDKVYLQIKKVEKAKAGCF